MFTLQLHCPKNEIHEQGASGIMEDGKNTFKEFEVTVMDVKLPLLFYINFLWIWIAEAWPKKRK